MFAILQSYTEMLSKSGRAFAIKHHWTTDSNHMKIEMIDLCVAFTLLKLKPWILTPHIKSEKHNQIHNNVCLCTHSGDKKSSLHISYPITKQEKCHFPRFLVCTEITDDCVVSQNVVKSCSDGYTLVAHLFAAHVFIHWSVVKYNATVFMCVCCSKKSSTIYLYIYSYITKKLSFKIIFLE